MDNLTLTEWLQRVVITIVFITMVLGLYSMAEAKELWVKCLTQEHIVPCKVVEDKGIYINGVMYPANVVKDVIEFQNEVYAIVVLEEE